MRVLRSRQCLTAFACVPTQVPLPMVLPRPATLPATTAERELPFANTVRELNAGNRDSGSARSAAAWGIACGRSPSSTTLPATNPTVRLKSAASRAELATDENPHRGLSILWTNWGVFALVCRRNRFRHRRPSTVLGEPPERLPVALGAPQIDACRRVRPLIGPPLPRPPRFPPRTDEHRRARRRGCVPTRTLTRGRQALGPELIELQLPPQLQRQPTSALPRLLQTQSCQPQSHDRLVVHHRLVAS
jgi:hypothetical protein